MQGSPRKLAVDYHTQRDPSHFLPFPIRVSAVDDEFVGASNGFGCAHGEARDLRWRTPQLSIPYNEPS